jgi:exopolysaccharide production protein ExoQ
MRPQIERIYFAIEKLVVVSAFLYFMQAIIKVLTNPAHVTQNAQYSDRLGLIQLFLVYGAATIFMLPKRVRILQAFEENPVLCCLLGLALVSCVWSPTPLFTLRRTIILLATSAFGFYLGTRFEIRRQMRLVAHSLGFCIVLSVIFIVALPRYGVDLAIFRGAWRGVFYQKNALGSYMTVAGLTFLCLHTRSLAGLLVKYVGLAFSVLLLIGARAVGAYVVTAILILLIPFFRLLRLNWKKLIVAGTAALTILGLAVAYVVSNADAFLQLLGKDSTFTTRVPLWETVLTVSSSHRWWGYGFEGFWAANERAVWSMVLWKPARSHNGFIDLLADLGWLGLGLFALNTAIVARRCLKLVTHEQTLESQWPLLMLSLVLLYNVFESNLMIENNFLWVLYVAITVSTQRALSLSRTTVPLAEPEEDLLVAGCEPCPQ